MDSDLSRLIGKDRTPVPVSYMLVPSPVSNLPCYVGLVWPQPA